MEAARDRSRSRSHSPTEECDAPGLAALYARLQGDFNTLQEKVFLQREIILLHERDLATLRLQVATLMSSR